MVIEPPDSCATASTNAVSCAPVGILESLGLAAALDALADGPVPFVLVAAPTQRLGQPQERAVYHITSTSLAHPHQDVEGLPAPIRAAIQTQGDTLHLHLSGLGALPTQLIQRWEDHVGALGGTIRVLGSTVECELPCG